MIGGCQVVLRGLNRVDHMFVLAMASHGLVRTHVLAQVLLCCWDWLEVVPQTPSWSMKFRRQIRHLEKHGRRIARQGRTALVGAVFSSRKGVPHVGANGMRDART